MIKSGMKKEIPLRQKERYKEKKVGKEKKEKRGRVIVIL